MSTVLKAATDEQLRVSLFDRWKSRPLPDPNRPRPVVDAIKSLLTSFVTSAGPTLMPMLLQILQQAMGSINIGGTTAASAASLAEPASLDEASDCQLIDELASRHATAASAILPDYDWFKALFLDAVNHIGPVAVGWFIEQLQHLFDAAPAE